MGTVFYYFFLSLAVLSEATSSDWDYIENFILGSKTIEGSFYDFVWQTTSKLQAEIDPSTLGRYSIAYHLSGFGCDLDMIYRYIPENFYSNADIYDLTNRMTLAGFDFDQNEINTAYKENTPLEFMTEEIRIVFILMEKSISALKLGPEIRRFIRRITFDENFQDFQSFLRRKLEKISTFDFELGSFIFSSDFAAKCVLFEIGIYLRKFQKIGFSAVVEILNILVQSDTVQKWTEIIQNELNIIINDEMISRWSQRNQILLTNSQQFEINFISKIAAENNLFINETIKGNVVILVTLKIGLVFYFFRIFDF